MCMGCYYYVCCPHFKFLLNTLCMHYYQQHTSILASVAVMFAEVEWDAADWSDRVAECAAALTALRSDLIVLLFAFSLFSVRIYDYCL